MEILNDRVKAQELLDKGFVFRKCFFKQLQSLIRYMYAEGKEKDEIIRECARLLRVEDKEGYKYSDIIDIDNDSRVLDNLYESAIKKRYKDDLTVYFSQGEMNYIDEVKTDRGQRVLFTIMALLKVQQMKDLEAGAKKIKTFITTKIVDIMKFANISTIKNKERNALMSSLLSTGKLEMFVTTKGEDICYRPLYKASPGEEYTMPVTTAEPFGKQWVSLMRKDMFQCVDCGQWFPESRRRGGAEGVNYQKSLRCKECNKIHIRELKREWKRKADKKKKEEKENGIKKDE